jgi:hypothetical protein
VFALVGLIPVCRGRTPHRVAPAEADLLVDELDAGLGVVTPVVTVAESDGELVWVVEEFEVVELSVSEVGSVVPGDVGVDRKCQPWRQ